MYSVSPEKKKTSIEVAGPYETPVILSNDQVSGRKMNRSTKSLMFGRNKESTRARNSIAST